VPEVPSQPNTGHASGVLPRNHRFARPARTMLIRRRMPRGGVCSPVAFKCLPLPTKPARAADWLRLGDWSNKFRNESLEPHRKFPSLESAAGQQGDQRRLTRPAATRRDCQLQASLSGVRLELERLGASSIIRAPFDASTPLKRLPVHPFRPSQDASGTPALRGSRLRHSHAFASHRIYPVRLADFRRDRFSRRPAQSP
jgi:hypothetical protein